MSPQLLEALSAISTPLAFASLALLVFSGIGVAVLKLNIFPKLLRTQALSLLRVLIWRAFQLSLAAVVLGFIAFMAMQLISARNIENSRATILPDKLILPIQSGYSIRYASPATNPAPFGLPRSVAFSKDKAAVLLADVGSPVVAVAAGVVEVAELVIPYGMQIKIRHANGISTTYSHLSRISVEGGAFVVRGQVIGEVGSTGRVGGPQLRFAISLNSQPVDALSALLSNLSAVDSK